MAENNPISVSVLNGFRKAVNVLEHKTRKRIGKLRDANVHTDVPGSGWMAMTRDSMVNLSALIEDYRERHKPRLDVQRTAYERMSLNDAITYAALAKPKGGGKDYSHQRRIPDWAKERARLRLFAAKSEIANARNFDDLLTGITSALHTVLSRAELFCYDAALRIGAHLRLKPDRVYLHAGTREGAANLGLDTTRGWLLMSELPDELHVLTPEEAEDFLCVYKDQFIAGTDDPGLCGDAPVKPRRGCA